MATDILSPETADDFDEPRRPLREMAPSSSLERILRPLASLKLTVTLFALAIFLVLTGTLAQTTHDIWWVLHHYFRAPVAWIELRVFFPPGWWADYPSLQDMTWAFPFPGGFTIGGLMAVNLLAAHGLRFTVQAKGSRLWAGLGVIAFGCLVTWLVIAAGPDKDGSQATAPVDWVTLWRLFLLGLVGACAGIGASVVTIEPQRRTERVVLAGVGVALLGLFAFLYHTFGFNGNSINPSAMRILWQLLKAEFAAVVLLAGCYLLFRKRAGIVLLHAGVGLIMANELVVHFMHNEAQMTISEGGDANYAHDIRTTELAIVDRQSNPKSDDVLAIPESWLRESAKDRQAISDVGLPFDIRLLKFFENSTVFNGPPKSENLADAGAGTKNHAVAVRPVTGADSGDRVNQPSAYVQFIDKKSGELIGSYLLGVVLEPQEVTAGGKEYFVALQFKRDYKPYSVHLYEVRGDNYLGTSIPRNYSSTIQLVDREHGVDRKVHIKMNEPLRFGGETFYQSGYDDGVRQGRQVLPKSTTLQIVANTGWMIPYVACMVVMTGMLAQFLITLSRFLKRRDAGPTLLAWGAVTGNVPAAVTGKVLANRNRTQAKDNGNVKATAPAKTGSLWTILLPAAVLGLFGYCAVTSMMPPQRQVAAIDLYVAGKLPVVYGGRVQPLDSVARSTLRSISSREVFLDNNGVTQPAMLWLMDVIARPKIAAQHRVFRIDSPDVRDLLGLPIHPPTSFAGKLFGEAVQRYSPAELTAHPEELKQFHREIDLLLESGAREGQPYTTVEKKLVELHERGRTFQAVADAFHLAPELKSEIAEPAPEKFVQALQKLALDSGAEEVPKIPFMPTKDELETNRERGVQIIQMWMGLNDRFGYDRFLAGERPPLAIPSLQSRDVKAARDDDAAATAWTPYASSWLSALENVLLKEEPNPAVAQWQEIIDAYANQDASAFNAAVSEYAKSLQLDPPQQLAKASPAFEEWFNHAELFSLAQWFYFLAFCLVGFFWLTGWRPLNRAAFCLIVGVFLVHTFALVARMTISGRPPVTNLYSTALFIGWVVVLLGLILELVFYRLGLGAAVAAVAGFATLLIADKLSLLVDSETRGDTIGVMRAVLDTQFWLATHVTTINMGYATTYLAGLLGLLYIVAGVFTKALSKETSKLLARMIYGGVCFAMIFSFFGTVLGGLWADDSWGRFWGWDPKENGALMIVLWNALVLHARWDGWVKDRGLAVLAVGGNIVTSWSYFGVNQLGIGLHSYGFTEGVLLALGIFCLSQLAMIGLGLLPRHLWRSAAA